MSVVPTRGATGHDNTRTDPNFHAGLFGRLDGTGNPAEVGSRQIRTANRGCWGVSSCCSHAEHSTYKSIQKQMRWSEAFLGIMLL